MKKSNQFSNKLIAKKDLINSISALSAFLIVIFGIIMFLMVLSPEQDKMAGKTTFYIEQHLHSMDTPTLYHFCAEHENVFIFAILGGLALGISQFEFLHRKKYCSTLLSFGIKRNRVFWNRLIIPLVLALFCIILPYTIALKLNIEVFGFKADMFPWFFFELIRVIRVFLTCYTISIVACVFTGRTIEAAAGAVSIAFLPLTAATLTDIIFDLSLFGYAGPYYSHTADILVKADPTFISSLTFSRGFDRAHPINTPLDSDAIIQIAFSIIWILISVAVIALANCYFCKKFKPESSGFKGNNKAISIIISFTAPLFLSALAIDYFNGQFSPIVSNSVALLVIVLGTAFGFIASIISGLVIHLTHKKLKISLIGGLALGGTIGIVTILGITGIFGTYHNTPKAEEIKEIEITAPFNEFFPNLNGEPYFIRQYICDSTTALVITDENDIETILELHKRASKKSEDTTASRFKIVYTLNDGSKIIRNYEKLSCDATEKILRLWDTKAAKEMYKNCLFPKINGTENLDISPRYSIMGCEHPYIMNYYDNDAFILIKTRDGEIKSVLNEITEKEFTKLKNAIYKDICQLNSSDWFTPEETQIGTLSFSFASYQNNYAPNEAKCLNFYINPNMKSTVKALKDLDLYKHFECKKEIEEVLVGDIRDYSVWENQSLSESKNAEIHQPFFTSGSDGFISVCFNSEEAGYTKPPVKEVTDKLQIKSLTEKGYIAYNIMNNGKIVFVKYTDETYSSYVIPYEK